MGKTVKTKSKFEFAIVENVKAIRKLHDKTQTYIAMILDVSDGYVGQIESQKSPSMYSFDQLNIIAKDLGCSPKDFFPEDAVWFIRCGMNTKNQEYSKAIADRIQMIMITIDLDVAGFAEFYGKSTSHIYGILNGARPLSEVFAREIGEKLEFDGAKIFNLNSKIPLSISKAEALIKFKIDHRNNPEYFLSTKLKRSANSFVAEVLLKSDCFNGGYKYLNEVTEYCQNELNREFIDDQLSKALQYAVKIKMLKSTKKPIKLKSGGFGKRLVDIYYL